jgi:hypothetical protein
LSCLVLSCLNMIKLYTCSIENILAVHSKVHSLQDPHLG